MKLKISHYSDYADILYDVEQYVRNLNSLYFGIFYIEVKDNYYVITYELNKKLTEVLKFKNLNNKELLFEDIFNIVRKEPLIYLRISECVINEICLFVNNLSDESIGVFSVNVRSRSDILLDITYTNTNNDSEYSLYILKDTYKTTEDIKKEILIWVLSNEEIK